MTSIAAVNIMMVNVMTVNIMMVNVISALRPASVIVMSAGLLGIVCTVFLAPRRKKPRRVDPDPSVNWAEVDWQTAKAVMNDNIRGRR